MYDTKVGTFGQQVVTDTLPEFDFASPTWFLDLDSRTTIIDCPSRMRDIKSVPFLLFSGEIIRFKETRVKSGEVIHSNIAEWAGDYLVFINGRDRWKNRIRFSLDLGQRARIVSLDELPRRTKSAWMKKYILPTKEGRARC